MKKKYQKPGIHSISIDREISLVMMTDNNNPPTPPNPRGASAQGSSSELNSTELQDNPFGTYTKD